MLSDGMIVKIDAVFANAAMSGRRNLYEFEVYAILEALGLSVPHYVYVQDVHEISDHMLRTFQRSAVVKIVSPDIAHKSKLGGVKKIDSLDPMFVRFVLHNMKEEVLSHFPGDQKPRIDGFLIAECIPFTLALGNEILIGVKEDPSFGPILTLSKGGDDAEFFAKFYDPANLLLVPIEEEDAKRVVQSTKIRHKYEQFHQVTYADRIAKALHIISRFAATYAITASVKPKYYVKGMDINPFVFSENGSFTAVDGFIEFQTASEHGALPERPHESGLKPYFHPKGIVVAGVSSDTTKYNLARNVVQLLFDLDREDIYCVNPKGGTFEMDGKTHPLYASLADVPEPYDLIVYAAPAQHTVSFIEQVPDNKCVVLISGLPADMPFQDFVQGIHQHRDRGIRFVGPNCMGVFFAPLAGCKGVNTLFIGEERLRLGYNERSNTALLTQSGAMAITSIERTQNLPIYRSIVSFGNKVDVNVPDLMAYFENEPTVELMALYIEGMGDGEGRRMFEVAKASKKPIIIYKSGRTEAGAKAAASHTAAMSGNYDVFRAACEQAGIVLVEELSDFYNDMKVFSMLSKRIPKGRRVSGVVNAGLDATMGADTLNFLVQANFSAETKEKLRKINRHGLVDTNMSFLDVTPMTDDTMFAEFVDAILSDESVDCAFVAIVPHIENLMTTDDVVRAPDSVASKLIAVSNKHNKPLVVSINSGNHYQELVKYLEENGLPVFSDIRSAIKALDVFTKHHVGSDAN